MEGKNHDIKYRSALQASLIQQTLASWRFFLLFSCPPLLWALVIVQLNLAGIFILLLCGMVWFGCWRLWLDERYFRLINEENNDLAGEALHTIWRRKKLEHREFAQRQQGALTLFRKTMWLTGIMWLSWLIAALCAT